MVICHHPLDGGFLWQGLDFSCRPFPHRLIVCHGGQTALLKSEPRAPRALSKVIAITGPIRLGLQQSTRRVTGPFHPSQAFAGPPQVEEKEETAPVSAIPVAPRRTRRDAISTSRTPVTSAPASNRRAGRRG